MKISRPKPRIPIPKFARLTSHNDIGKVYEWDLKLQNGKIKHFTRNAAHFDTLDLIAITQERKVLLVEFQIAGETKYRFPEIDVKQTEDVLKKAFVLVKKLGVVSDNLELFASSQPGDVGKYPIEWALYFFISTNVKPLKNPNLDYKISYKLISLNVEDFLSKLKNGDIENSSFLYKHLDQLSEFLMH